MIYNIFRKIMILIYHCFYNYPVQLFSISNLKIKTAINYIISYIINKFNNFFFNVSIKKFILFLTLIQISIFIFIITFQSSMVFIIMALSVLVLFIKDRIANSIRRLAIVAILFIIKFPQLILIGVFVVNVLSSSIVTPVLAETDLELERLKVGMEIRLHSTDRRVGAGYPLLWTGMCPAVSYGVSPATKHADITEVYLDPALRVGIFGSVGAGTGVYGDYSPRVLRYVIGASVGIPHELDAAVASIQEILALPPVMVEEKKNELGLVRIPATEGIDIIRLTKKSVNPIFLPPAVNDKWNNDIARIMFNLANNIGVYVDYPFITQSQRSDVVLFCNSTKEYARNRWFLVDSDAQKDKYLGMIVQADQLKRHVLNMEVLQDNGLRPLVQTSIARDPQSVYCLSTGPLLDTLAGSLNNIAKYNSRLNIIFHSFDDLLSQLNKDGHNTIRPTIMAKATNARKELKSNPFEEVGEKVNVELDLCIIRTIQACRVIDLF